MELTKAAGLTMQEIVQELIRSGHGAVQTREKVRDFVGDPTTIATSDFYIRRHIQLRFPRWIAASGVKNVPDLVGSEDKPVEHMGHLNREWPMKLIDFLAEQCLPAQLEKVSLSSRQADIRSRDWVEYLTGTVPSRERIFQIAVTLQMDARETARLLLLCGEAPYSIRDPMEFTILCCQSVPELFNWFLISTLKNQIHKVRYLKSEEAARLLHKALEGPQETAEQCLMDFLMGVKLSDKLNGGGKAKKDAHLELQRNYDGTDGWDAKKVRAVASALRKRATRQGFQFPDKQPYRWLMGEDRITKREHLYQLAFAMELDRDRTDRLMTVYGRPLGTPWQGERTDKVKSTQNPLSVICLFLQSRSKKPAWRDVERLTEWLQRLERQRWGTSEPMTEGATQEMQDIPGYFEGMSRTRALKEIGEMLQHHRNEFAGLIIDHKLRFLPGFSVTQAKLVLRLSKYLAIACGFYDDPYNFDEADGYPELAQLHKLLNADSTGLPAPGEKSLPRWRGMDRLRRTALLTDRATADEEANVEYLKRTDLLDLAVCFITRVQHLVDHGEEDRLQQLKAHCLQEQELWEDTLDVVMERKILEPMMSGNRDLLYRMDTLLEELSCVPLYLCAAPDREAALRLLGLDPEL